MTRHAVDARTRPVLCVSPLGPDTATLLSAFGLLVDDRPGLTLEVLGTGPLEAPVRRRAGELGIEQRVHIRRQLPAADIREMVMHSAVLVLPAPDREVADEGRRLQRLLADGFATHPAMVVVGAEGPARLIPGRPPVVLMPADDPVVLARALADLLDAPPSARAAVVREHEPVAGRRSWFRRPRP
jgi:glycosyltransferase involved in cell wall biosynthesis